MMRVAIQVASQVGVVVGATISALSEKISKSEVLLPNFMTDVGIFGLIVTFISGLALICLARKESVQAMVDQKAANTAMAGIQRKINDIERILAEKSHSSNKENGSLSNEQRAHIIGELQRLKEQAEKQSNSDISDKLALVINILQSVDSTLGIEAAFSMKMGLAKLALTLPITVAAVKFLETIFIPASLRKMSPKNR
jgi:hypothetical protein